MSRHRVTQRSSRSLAVIVVLLVAVLLLSLVLAAAMYRKRLRAIHAKRQALAFNIVAPRLSAHQTPASDLSVHDLLSAVSGPQALDLYTRLHKLCVAANSSCRRLLKNKYVEFAYAVFLLDQKDKAAQQRGLRTLKKIRGEYRIFGLFPSIFPAWRNRRGLQTVKNLMAARKGQKTQLRLCHPSGHLPLYRPPADLFQVVYYPSSIGYLAAYLHIPKNVKRYKHQQQKLHIPKNVKLYKHRQRTIKTQRYPAILWAHQGSVGVSSAIWKSHSTVSALLRQGFVVMVPTWRGEHDNPGSFEFFWGEVEDALYAIHFLRKRSYVDPSRIYMMGHREGGTLTLLTTQATRHLRASFSFSGTPFFRVNDMKYVQRRCEVSALSSATTHRVPPVSEERLSQESRWRSAASFLSALQTPTFYFAGTHEKKLASFVKKIQDLKPSRIASLLHSYRVVRGSYRSYVRPLVMHIFTKLKADTGVLSELSFSRPYIRNVALRSYRSEVKMLWLRLRHADPKVRWWAVNRLSRLSFYNAQLQRQLQTLLRDLTEPLLKVVLSRSFLEHPVTSLRQQAMHAISSLLRSSLQQSKEQRRKGSSFYHAYHSLFVARFSPFEDVSRWSSQWLEKMEPEPKLRQKQHKQIIASRQDLDKRVRRLRALIWARIAPYQRSYQLEKQQRRRFVAAYFLAFYAMRRKHPQARDYMHEVLLQHPDDHVKSGIYWGYLNYGTASQREIAFGFYGRKARENVHKKYNPFYCALRHAVEQLKDPVIQNQAKFAMLAIRNNTLFRTYLNRSCPYVEISWADLE